MEEFWYRGNGWRTLRGRCVRLAVELCSGAPASFVNGDSADTAHTLIRELTEELAQRAHNAPGSLWPYALSLLGDVAAAEAAVRSAWSGIQSTGEHEDAGESMLKARRVGRALRGFLEDARREVDLGSANRRKVWERLSTISMTVKAGDGGAGGRCNEEHFAAVLAACSERYPNDRNLPRTMAGVEQYFREFCPDCEGLNAIDMEVLLTATTPTPGEPDILEQLTDCLEKLANEAPATFEAVTVKYRLHEGAPETASSYQSRTGVSRRGFDQRVDHGILSLKECLELDAPM